MDIEKEKKEVEKKEEEKKEEEDKYAFIEEYLVQPNINTRKPIPILIKLISTILYLRQRLDYEVDISESFYNNIKNNDYTIFQDSTQSELFKILVCFVSFTCGYINESVEDEEDREKITTTLKEYYNP